MKHLIKRKKIIYSVLLLTLSAVLLIALTLSWFMKEPSTTGALDIFVSGSDFTLYHTIDENHDGMPDTKDGEEIFVAHNGEPIVFSYCFPGYITRFRIITTTSNKNARFYLYFTDVESIYSGSEDTENEPPEIDLTEVFMFRETTDEHDGQLTSLKDMPEDDDRIVLLDSEPLDEDEDGAFVYTYDIIMDELAGNEYKNWTLKIGKVVFGVDGN